MFVFSKERSTFHQCFVWIIVATVDFGPMEDSYIIFVVLLIIICGSTRNIGNGNYERCSVLLAEYNRENKMEKEKFECC